MKKIILRIPYLNKIYLIFQLVFFGYLRTTGWLSSLFSNSPIGPKGIEYPWLTYPFISLLEERLKSDFVVFEYGSGNSTLYFAQRVKEITSIEHNEVFYIKMKQRMPKNVNYQFYELHKDDYPNSIRNENKKFDIVVIDGRERVNCCKVAVDYLKEQGVIIFDNSIRPRYKDGFNFLIKNGFRYIHFFGLNPLGTNTTVTTIFYKSNNCFDI